MAPSTRKRARDSTANSLDMLNSINESDARKRRHTVLEGTTSDLPSSPQRRTRRPRTTEPVRFTRSMLQNIGRDGSDGSLPQSAESNPDRDPQPPEEDPIEPEPEDEDEGKDEDKDRDGDEAADEDKESDEDNTQEKQLPPPSGQHEPKANEPEVVIDASTRDHQGESSTGNTQKKDWISELGLREASSGRDDLIDVDQISSNASNAVRSYLGHDSSPRSDFRSARSSIPQSLPGQRPSPVQTTYFDRSRVIIHAQDDPFGDGAESHRRQALTPGAAEHSQNPSFNLDSWLNDAIAGSPQEHAWKTIRGRGKTLRLRATKPMPKPFKPIRNLCVELRRLHEKIAGPGDMDSVSIARGLLESQNLRHAIHSEAFRIFKYAAEQVQDASAPYLVDQFEAHIVPRIVTLVIICFKTFCTVGDHAQEEVCGVLGLLLEICVRIVDLRKEETLVKYPGCPNVAAHSRTLRVYVKRVMKALGKAHPSQVRSVTLDANAMDDIPPSREPWTEEETKVLIHALKCIPPSSVRYIQIQRRWGHRFRGRTGQDLKAKAQEMRRQFVAKCPSHRLQDPNMQWILDV